MLHKYLCLCDCQRFEFGKDTIVTECFEEGWSKLRCYAQFSNDMTSSFLLFRNEGFKKCVIVQVQYFLSRGFLFFSWTSWRDFSANSAIIYAYIKIIINVTLHYTHNYRLYRLKKCFTYACTHTHTYRVCKMKLRNFCGTHGTKYGQLVNTVLAFVQRKRVNCRKEKHVYSK